MSALKQRIIDDIIKREGGYTDDAADSGGKTRYGITEVVARANGYTGAMRDLPRPVAVSIYEKQHLAPLRFDDLEALSPAVAEEVADSGVNVGTGRAGKWLQTALNALNDNESHYADISTDGVIGQGTLKALSAFLKKRGTEGEVVLLRALNGLQAAFYVDLSQNRPKDERFLYGWILNRVSGDA